MQTGTRIHKNSLFGRPIPDPVTYQDLGHQCTQIYEWNVVKNYNLSSTVWQSANLNNTKFYTFWKIEQCLMFGFFWTMFSVPVYCIRSRTCSWCTLARSCYTVWRCPPWTWWSLRPGSLCWCWGLQRCRQRCLWRGETTR